MDEIGVFTPDQARKLWQDYLQRQQQQPHQQHNYPRRRIIDEVSPHRVFVRNDSGEEIPAYGCLQITGTATVGGRTALKVDKPDSTDGEYVFNSQFAIAVGAAGWAYRFGIVLMLGDEPTSVGAGYQPIVGSWEIEEGGDLFSVWGRHNANARALIGRIDAGGSGAKRIRFTIADVHCPDDVDPDLWIAVDWTDYTGGCVSPPGVEYDGTIKVYDSCILDYYTADDLIGKEGSATYWYPREGYCEPRWIVDSICGQPECDE